MQYARNSKPRTTRPGFQTRPAPVQEQQYEGSWAPTEREKLWPWELRFDHNHGYFVWNRDTNEEKLLGLNHRLLHQDTAADRVTLMNLRNESNVTGRPMPMPLGVFRAAN